MNSSPYKKTHPLIGIFWIGFALAFCGAGLASAQTVYYYTGNASNTAGNWTQSNSWTSGTIAVTNTSGNYQLRVVNGSNATLIYSAAQGNTTYVTTARGLLIGSGTTGSLSITGGTFSTSGSTSLQDVLGNSNTSGTLSLDGGNFTGSAVGLNMLLNGGATTTANLTINSGTATLPKLEIGFTSTSAGTAIINLNGGTMNLTTLTRTSTSANSTFNFNGGNLVVGGSSTIYLQGLTRANIRNGTTTINTAGYDITISQNLLHSNIAGDAAIDGGLIKAGSGTLTLNGSNTYTGTTTINAGTLAVSGGAALLNTGTVTLANTNGAVFAVNASETIGSLQGGGTSGGNTVIASGQTLTIAETGNQTYSGSISGFGGLVKSGGGDLTLAGNNSYTGGTTITGAENLELTANNALGNGSLTFNASSTARLRLNGTNQTVTSLSILGAGTSIIENQGGGNGSMTFNIADGLTSSSTSNFRFRDNASGTGTLALVKTGNGTLDFSTTGSMNYSGGLTVNGGVISYNATAALGTGAISLGGGTLNYTGASGGSVTISNTNISLTAGTTSILNNANGTVTVSGTIGGTGNLTKSGAGTLTLSAANTYSGETLVSAGTLTLSNALALQNSIIDTSGAGVITLSSVTTPTFGGLKGSGNLSSVITTGYSTITGITLNPGSGVSNTYSGAISNGAANMTLTKNGAGTQVLSGNNTYSGTTTINTGNLTLSGGSAISDSGTVTLANTAGAILHVAQSETIGVLSGGGASGGNVSIAGGQAIGINATSTFSGSISGAGALIKNGTGTLTLNGSSTYTGGTTIRSGILSLGANNALGNGSLTFDLPATTGFNSFLRLNGTNQTITGLTINTSSSQSVIENNGGGSGVLTIDLADGVTGSSTSTTQIRDGGTGTLGLVKTGNGTLNFSTYAAMNYSGGLTVNGGNFSYNNVLALGNSTAGGAIILGGGTLNYTGSSSVTIANNATLTAGTTSMLNNAAGTVTITGTIGGTGNLTKSGAGTLTLSAANTYQGATTVSAGTLSTSAADRISDSSALSVASGATFLLGGSETVGSIAGAGNYSIAGFTLTVGGDNTSTTVSGNITGASGAVTKSGSGTLTLSGTNSYTGATTINAGTLTISSGAAITDTGTVTLANTSGVAFNVNTSETIASLQGGGASGGNVTIASAQTLTVAEANTNTFSGSLQGAGNFTKSGLGTLTLNGTSANGGAVSVTGGTVVLSGASALASSTSLLSAASSTTLSLADGVGRTITLSTGNLSLTSATMVFELGSTSDRLTLTSGAATLSGTNTIRLADIGSFAAGTYTLISANSGLNGNWSLDSTSGPTGFTYTLSNSSTTLSLIAAANSNNFYWTGSASANWSGDNFSATDGGASTLSGGNLSAASDLIFAATGATNLATTMDSNYTVNSLSITTPGVSIGGSNTLTVNSTASTAIGISAASGNTTISANLAGASAGLTKSGAGTLILTGNNTYTGATTITAGTLQIGANGTSGALSITSTLTNNGTLVFNRSNAITQGMDFANVIAGSGNIIKNGAGNLTLNGTNTFTGQLTIAEGAVIVSTMNNSGAAGVFGNSTNSVVLGSSANNGTLSFTGGTVTSSKRFTMATGGTGVFDVATGGQLTVGQIDGSGALSKTGAGNLVLGSANTYSGGSTLGGSGVVVVTIDSVGTVGAPTSGAFGTGTVNLAGAQLRAGTGGSRTVANAITISADTTFVTTGSEKSLTFTGPVTLSGATRTLNVAIGSNVTTEKLTFSGAIGDGGNGFGITKTGAGTLSLSAANTYTGTTTVSAGTLEIGHVNALQNTTLDTGTSGAQTVNFTVTGANTYNIGGLQGADALSIGNNTISIGANNANTTYSGGISGTGNLVKTGSGTQTLAGATTFNGTTTVNSGTLQAATANALANTSQVVLNNGGSFLVTADDAIGTNTGIELNGGTLAFGAAGYDGYVGALTLSANSTIDLGTSSNGVLIRFNSINWNNSNALLSIYNWTGNTYYQGGYDNNLDKVIFTNPNFTTSELQRISFYSGIDQSSFVGDATLITSGLFPNQIIAVPETETYITGVILLLGFTIYQIRLARQGEGLLARLTFLRQRKS